MRSPHPTLRHRQLAKRLRELRINAGLKIEDVAHRLGCSASRISRLETAQRGIRMRDVRELCEMYGVDDESSISELLTLARDAHQHGWWQDFEDLDLNPYIELESAASSIVNYSTSIVPALVQTQAYAAAIIRGCLPRIAETTLADRVAARKKRKQLLDVPQPPELWMLLDESVLHRHVGGSAVMSEQLGELVRFGDRARFPHVTLQVIPYTEGAHMGMDGGFVFLKARDSGIPDTVYTEGIFGAHYYEKPTQVSKFVEAIGHLKALALNPARSIELIQRVRASLEP